MTSYKTGSSPSGSPGHLCVFTLFFYLLCMWMFHFVHNFPPIWITEFHNSFWLPQVLQKLFKTVRTLEIKLSSGHLAFCWQALLTAGAGDAVSGFSASLSYVWRGSCFDVGRHWQGLCPSTHEMIHFIPAAMG